MPFMPSSEMAIRRMLILKIATSGCGGAHTLSTGLARRANKIYAVKVGRVPGIYDSWAEAEAQVEGFQGAVHKSFGADLRSVATAFIAGQTEKGPASSPFRLVAYADGGFRDGIAGIGVNWTGEPNVANLSERLPDWVQDSARAELYAILRVLETDPGSTRPLSIHTDSAYTREVFSRFSTEAVSSMTKRSGSGPSKQQTAELIKLVVDYLRHRPAPCEFVRAFAHSGEYGNEIADQLATEGTALPIAVSARNFLQELTDRRKARQRLRKSEASQATKLSTHKTAEEETRARRDREEEKRHTKEAKKAEKVEAAKAKKRERAQLRKKEKKAEQEKAETKKQARREARLAAQDRKAEDVQKKQQERGKKLESSKQVKKQGEPRHADGRKGDEA